LATIFVTGSDTGVGKTRVAGWIARALSARGATQVVKPVESGVAMGRPADALAAAGDWASAHTLVALPLPLAPLAAAAQANVRLSLPWLTGLYTKLPATKHRVIEGAGGIAVPIDPLGKDWADFIAAIRPDLVVVVVDDRLGAINQARLAADYLAARHAGSVGIWLNAAHTTPDPAVALANREGICDVGLVLIGESSFGAHKPEKMELP
jgi:dethiobiotin synthetase